MRDQRWPSLRVVIRPAAPADRAALARLVKELNVHQDDPTEHFSEATVDRDVFGPDAYLDALVAERDGDLVGYAFSHDGYESGYAARGIYLCDLYVVPHARRQKVGRALIAAWRDARKHAAARSCGGHRVTGTSRRSRSTTRSVCAMNRSWRTH
jgi:GNAT superfamily N-acetyltransferase